MLESLHLRAGWPGFHLAYANGGLDAGINLNVVYPIALGFNPRAENQLGHDVPTLRGALDWKSRAISPAASHHYSSLCQALLG